MPLFGSLPSGFSPFCVALAFFRRLRVPVAFFLFRPFLVVELFKSPFGVSVLDSDWSELFSGTEPILFVELEPILFSPTDWTCSGSGGYLLSSPPVLESDEDDDDDEDDEEEDSGTGSLVSEAVGISINGDLITSDFSSRKNAQIGFNSMGTFNGPRD